MAIKYKNIFEANLISSIEHYFLDKKFYINIMDLFILIKYCDTTNLQKIANKLFQDKSIKKFNLVNNKEMFINKRYLLNVLKNIYELLIGQEESINIFSVNIWLNNLLIILAGAQWSTTQLKNIIDTVIPALECRTNDINLYHKIKFFIGANAFLYERSHINVLKFIDVIFYKIINNKMNGFDKHIIDSDVLKSIFNLSKKFSFKYDNMQMVNLAISKIQKFSDEEKRFFIHQLLLGVKLVGSDRIIKIIDKFINKYIKTLSTKTNRDIIDSLTLVVHGYSMPTNFLDILREFVSNIPNKVMDLNFIKEDVRTRFPILIEHIINNQGRDEFKSLLDEFNKTMKKVNTKHC